MTALLILQPFAASGDQATVPQTDVSGFVNWTNGYTAFYEIDLTAGNPLAKAVERPVQNYLFNLITANIQQWQQLGFARWYAGMPSGYVKGAQVMREDGSGSLVPYRSLVDSNVSDPLTTPTQWEYTPYAFEMVKNIPMPTGGASGSSAQVISAATDFNTFTTGTWQYKSDAVAAASAHAPAIPGGSSLAGMLESVSWANGADTYIAQRYLDRAGEAFFRGATNGSWTSWVGTTIASDYSSDTSATVNLVSATFALSSAILADNQRFWVKIANTNTGAVTFTPNPSVIGTPLPVVGQAALALQGGEIISGGRALLIYKADTNNFVLEFCSGAKYQVPDATASHQATSLQQVQSLIAAGSTSLSVLYYMGQI